MQVTWQLVDVIVTLKPIIAFSTKQDIILTTAQQFIVTVFSVQIIFALHRTRQGHVRFITLQLVMSCPSIQAVFTSTAD